MTRRRISFYDRLVFACVLGVFTGLTSAYERDVHHGLTKWLSLRAGFAAHEADAIARGNQRADSGGPQAIDVVLDYACALPDASAARRVQRLHFPAAMPLPTLPQQRLVIAGSEHAREQMQRVVQDARGKEQLMLALFGAALHTYQDSWSHAGIPTVPDTGITLKCSAELAASHPSNRGGWASHEADATSSYPDDAMQMARASYEALMAFPDIAGRKRSPQAWVRLEPEVRRFVNASTKAQKQAWFTEQGIFDPDIVAGITLPDGPKVHGSNVRKPSLLPELVSNTSAQYEVAQDLLEFYDKLLAVWISESYTEKALAAFLRFGDVATNTEIHARLSLLKMSDHGTAAALVHKVGNFSSNQLKKVNEVTRDPAAYARWASVADAMLPLVTKGAHASPLLPYIARDLPTTARGSPRAIAVLRMRHLPYDTVGLITEKTAFGWRLTKVLVLVDH